MNHPPNRTGQPQMPRGRFHWLSLHAAFCKGIYQDAPYHRLPTRGGSHQIRMVDLCCADVTDRAALPQNRIETLIGS